MDEVAPPLGSNEAGMPQDPQVLGDRTDRNAQQIGQSPHTEGPPRQKSDDLDAARRRKGAERPHRLRYTALSHPL